MINAAAVLLAALAAAAAAAAPPPAEDGAPAVDLARYMGEWHEIAHLPNFPQRGCTDTTVSYRLAEGGGFELVNACRKGGKLKEYHGRARPSFPGSTAKFRVRFVFFLAADYWIVDLDPGYRWAAVGGAKRDQFWVISRDRTLDEETYRAILERARLRGNDFTRLERTILTQPDPSPQK